MKDWNASVQYGDLKGTSAADGHENALFNMDKYLKQKGVDTDRYKPIGIDFYAGEGHLSFRFICEDQSSYTKEVVSIGFEKEQDMNDLFVILKRLNVMLLPRNFSPEEYDWTNFDSSIMIEDRF